MEAKRIKIKLLISIFCAAFFVCACNPMRINPNAFSDDEYIKFRVLGMPLLYQAA